VRVPFTRIVPTALAVIDTSNDSSSGAGCAMCNCTDTEQNCCLVSSTWHVWVIV
jgi:hypothetical protein